ncbi:MAG: tetratricopeptide repeat protein [Candidatus Coatesbacteria bacterium]|nr:tetratricopeptide repeat protein [Candidatus Coatesbacteria bacterium]
MPELIAKFYQWLSSLTESPVVSGFLLTVAGILIVLFLKGLLGRIFPGGRRSKAVSRRLNFFEKRKVIRQAEYFMDDGDYQQAGALLDSIGEFERSLQAYLKGNELTSAASLAEKLQRYNQAASIYAKLEEFDRAAALYERSEDHGVAREMYISAAEKAAEAGKNYVAAEMYVKADEPGKAAEMYNKAGNHEKAAVLFEAAKEYEKAANAYEMVYAQSLTRDFGASLSITKTGREAAVKGARSFEKASSYKSAARLYKMAGDVVRSAEMLSRAGDDVGAAEMLLEAKRYDDAVQAFHRAEDEKGALKALATKALDSEKFDEAAQLFEKTGDHIQAAALYERVGRTADAGRMFEAAGEYASAASMFVAASEWERAADNYERAGSNVHAARYYARAGNPPKAAPLFEAAEQFFEAGEAYMQVGKEPEAMSMFQRVLPASDNYVRASNLLGQLFASKGRHNLAIKKFVEITGGKPVTLENIEVFYNLSRAYEKTGQVEDAKSLYEKIILVDFNYKDANARLAALEKKGESQPS